MHAGIQNKTSWHKFSRIAVSSYFVSHDYSTSTMVQEAYCPVCTFTAYSFCHTSVLFSILQFYFFYRVQFFFALQFSHFFFFMFVSMIEVEGERRKVSFTKALNGVDVKFFFSILFTDK